MSAKTKTSTVTLELDPYELDTLRVAIAVKLREIDDQMRRLARDGRMQFDELLASMERLQTASSVIRAAIRDHAPACARCDGRPFVGVLCRACRDEAPPEVLAEWTRARAPDPACACCTQRWELGRRCRSCAVRCVGGEPCRVPR
jgi:hypothetical protein